MERRKDAQRNATIILRVFLSVVLGLFAISILVGEALRGDISQSISSLVILGIGTGFILTWNQR